MSNRIAITGYAVASPIGCTPSSIVRSLREGKTGLQLTDVGLGQPIWYARIHDEFSQFAAEAFAQLDGAQARLVEIEPGLGYGYAVGWEAWRHAQLDSCPPANVSRVASTLSSSKGFLRTYLYAHSQMLSSSPSPLVDSGEWLKAFSAETVGRWIAQKKGFCGPVMATPLACATGVISLIMAANLIREGVADVVLAGSAEYTANVMNLAGFLNMGALSPERTRPFHRNRSGFNAGEGAAAFIVESEGHAQARGVQPLAYLVGWDYRSEAYHITAVEPSGETAEFALRQTLRRAGWQPHDVEYINAHGTGTPLNDQAEAQVIERVFGDSCPYVSSLKAHIGHLLGASGSVELALTLAAMRVHFVPPTLGLDEPDPEFRLRFPRPAGEDVRIQRFMKFSLGFGGHVAMVALEMAS
ncbi:MAG: beta-ketoacyl-[acyl-carrier-protein] synthase family protein [Candidatus Hydrogenedentota bacterium]|nr:MAG: beta-ketoacyl-[acyl-carrier-protein] synthase family protein [Candidatus Hydrogenedentota bacterium]GIX44281.1 MAG: 3-oxoacyl-[acyl-carrier-protein] synthase 2 [Candidatus Sumerlaea sp.]